MNADRAAGSGPGGLPLPPASTTRSVSLRGTSSVAQLPPFFGRTPYLNGRDAATADEALIPESVGGVAAEPLTAEPPLVPAAEAVAEPIPEAALDVLSPDAVSIDSEALPFDPDALPFDSDAAPLDSDAPPLDPTAQTDLSAWFTNGLGEVSLAAEGSEPNVPDAEPVFGADSSVSAEAVFGVMPGEQPAPESSVDDAWAVEDDGIVEPAFEEDVHAAEEMLAERARGSDEFPLDAFIIPEDARRLPTGVATDSESIDSNGTGAASEVAARFEEISKLLREEDVNALLVKLARGDRLDALLAGFLAGYLSTHDA